MNKVSILNWWDIDDNIRQSENIRLRDSSFKRWVKQQIRKYPTQKSLAKKANISEALIIEWLKGKQRPKIGFLKKILKNLNTDYNEFNNKWTNITFPLNGQPIKLIKNIQGNQKQGYRIRLSPIESELIKDVGYCRLILDGSLEFYLKISKDDLKRKKRALFIPNNVSKSFLGDNKNIEIYKSDYNTCLIQNTEKYLIEELKGGYQVKLKIRANYNVLFPEDLLRRIGLVTGDIVYIKVNGIKEGFFIKIIEGRTDFMIGCYKNKFKIGQDIIFYLEKINKNKEFNFFNSLDKKLVCIKDNENFIVGPFSRVYGNQVVNFKKNIEFSREFGWLIGFWLAEGKKQSINFSIFSTKEEEIIKILKNLEILIDTHSLKLDVYHNNLKKNKLKEQISKLGNYTNMINKVYINKTYSNLGYEISYNSVFQKIIKGLIKKIMDNLDNFSDGFLIGILEGVIQGDGHTYNTNSGYKNIIFKISEPNPKLVKFYINLFLKLNWTKNIDYRIIIRNPPEKWNPKLISKTAKFFEIPTEQIRMHRDKKAKNILYGLEIKIYSDTLTKLYNLKFGNNVTLNKIKEHLNGGKKNAS